jgi:quinol monooxygenase YgiN
MVREIATIEINPGDAAPFEAAVAKAAEHFRAAPGCRSFHLERSGDRPGAYLLVVGWDSVAAHMTDFRTSSGFEAWRALAGPFFKQPPAVDHVETAFDGF